MDPDLLEYIIRTTMTTASYGFGGGGAEGGGSLSHLAPSPADSGVAELEAARLASDLADPTTFSIAPHSRCDRGAVRAERRRVGEAGARAAQLAAAARRDADALRARLEDAEWTLCRRSGELALVKTQLKERQNELTAKGHDYLQLKGEYRQIRENFERKEKELSKLQSENEEKDKTVKQLQVEVNRLNSKLAASESELTRNKDHSGQEIDRLKSELKELREELSDVSLSGYEGIESGRSMRGIYEMCKNGNEYHWNSNDSSLEDAEVQRLNGELPDLPCAERCQANSLIHRLKCEIETKENEFDKERRKWSEEKEKVLRYQKQLQLNYVQMFRRSRNLEAEVESLRLELELCNKNMKNLGKLGKTIEL